MAQYASTTTRPTRRFVFMAATVVGVLVALLAFLVLRSAPQAAADYDYPEPPDTHEVTIVDFAFGPAALDVGVGDTVVWTNQDAAPHTVTLGSGPVEFDSGPIDPGGSFSFTFEVAGVYGYGCSIHPSMQGSVSVGDGSDPEPLTHEVTIVDFAFAPAQLDVELGDTVVWTNQDSAPHTVTVSSGPVEFDSEAIVQGGSFSFTFEVAGTYDYFCSIHPSMQASVSAFDGSSAPTPTPTPTTQPTSAIAYH